MMDDHLQRSRGVCSQKDKRFISPAVFGTSVTSRYIHPVIFNFSVCEYFFSDATANDSLFVCFGFFQVASKQLRGES